MIVLYNLVLLPLLALVLPLALVITALSAKRREGFLQRWWPLPASKPDTVWVHTASVGEVEAAAPMIRRLLEREVPVVATTLTATGRERLRARFPSLPVRLAPLDLPGLVHVSVRRVQLSTLVLVETEIWPNLIAAARSAGARVLIVSGRISDRSYSRYRHLRGFLGSVLANVDHVGARSEEDRLRFVALGADPKRTSVVGDLKLDREAALPEGSELASALGDGPFLVGGSTHPGEEETLLSAWRSLRDREAPGLRLILAPRHPERVPEVLKTVRRFGLEPGLRSAGAARADVVVLDTIGELDAVYALAALVFVGGTLARVGGHNLLEPVQAGRIVVHGPHFENQRSQQRLLEPLDVLRPVQNARELVETLERLWNDPQRNAPAERARAALAEHRGASERALALILAGRASA